MRPPLRDGLKLKYLMPGVDRKGRVRWYVRRRGHKLVPMPDLPHDDPSFLEVYVKACAVEKAEAEPEVGTVASLCQKALGSASFASKSDGYRAMLRRNIDAIREKVGAARAKAVKQKHVEKNVEESSNPRDRLKAWRFLCAANKTSFDVNPAKLAELPDLKAVEGHEAWTREDVEAYRARHPIGTVKRAAMELLYWAGPRRGDACKLGSNNIGRDGVLQYMQGKTDFAAYTPWTCYLPEYAKGMESDRAMMHEALACLAGQPTFLATKAGKQRSANGLGNLIREGAREAKVRKSAHGLRKARAVDLAEAGGTTHQIAAWTGHQTLKEIEYYTKAANRRRAVKGLPPIGAVVPQAADQVPAAAGIEVVGG